MFWPRQTAAQLYNYNRLKIHISHSKQKVYITTSGIQVHVHQTKHLQMDKHASKSIKIFSEASNEYILQSFKSFRQSPHPEGAANWTVFSLSSVLTLRTGSDIMHDNVDRLLHLPLEHFDSALFPWHYLVSPSFISLLSSRLRSLVPPTFPWIQSQQSLPNFQPSLL